LRGRAAEDRPGGCDRRRAGTAGDQKTFWMAMS
jgi:hypothetical protein